MPRGKYSFVAGGKYNITLGTASHASGYKNTTTGNATHAEGQKTSANGDYSHSQGLSTTANGNYSHAQGRKTIAGPPTQPASLDNLSPLSQTVVINGIYQNYYEENNVVMIYYRSEKKRYRTKRKVKNLNFNHEKNQTTFSISPPIIGTPRSLRISNQSKGRCSHAQGFKTNALGDTSTAIGKNITVLGNTSVGIQLNNSADQVLSQDNTLAIIGGKVGIGTLSPEAALEVNGSVKIGSIQINPNGTVSGFSPSADNVVISGNMVRAINSNGNLIFQTNENGLLHLDAKQISIGRYAKSKNQNQHAEAGYYLNEIGDAQVSKYFLLKQTSNSNFVSLTTDGNFESPENLISISQKCTWMFSAAISAYNVTNNLNAAFSLRGALGHNGTSYSIIGRNILESFYDVGMESLKVQIECQSGFLKLKVSGLTGNIIKWHAKISINEVSHVE
jgi:hypothetical protein